MDKNYAIDYIQEHGKEALQKDKSGRGWICPICGSGSHKNGTGISENPKCKGHFTCWAGCFKNEDLIGILQKQYHCEFKEGLQRACDLLGVSLDGYGTERQAAEWKRGNRQQEGAEIMNGKHQEQAAEVLEEQEAKEDYTAFFTECHKNLINCDYLTKRGISERVQQMFNIGYCERWQSPKALKEGKNPPASARVIIPTSKYSYLARATKEDCDKKYKALKQGGVCLFNTDVFDSEKPVFVVEGEIDALSFVEIGYSAVGLGGNSNIGKFAEFVKNKKPSNILLLALDNDKEGQGQAAQKNLVAALQNTGAEFYEATGIYEEYKDANEFLQADRAGFIKSVEFAAAIKERLQQEMRAEYVKKNGTGRKLAAFLEDTKTIKQPISTGFKRFDELLGGGLYNQLVVVGAISAFGKTTFCLQVANEIARAGRDVIFFSLEMSTDELIAKSISNETARNVLYYSNKLITDCYDLRDNGKSHLSIIRGEWRNHSKGRENTESAIEHYSRYADRFFIVEGSGDISPNVMRNIISKHIAQTGQKPVVFVDYLQILKANATEGYIDKKAVVDDNISALRLIVRDFKIPVVAVSSLNRANYDEPISMSAFKESGGIEYTTDVLIGMQYKGVENEEGGKK